MSLFDTIHCEYSLPDPALQGEDFQTHDLGQSLGRYTLTRDGRLIRHPHGVDRLASDTGLSAGEDLRYHGDLHIHTSDVNGKLKEFRVRFTHGRVEWIRPELSELPEDPAPTAADLAEALDDWTASRATLEAELLRTLERIDPEVAKAAIETFANRDKAARWLAAPRQVFGGITAYRVLAQGGRDALMSELVGIQEGFFS